MAETEVTTPAGNITPLRPDIKPEPSRTSRRKDHSAAARKAKSRSKNKHDRDAGPAKDAPLPPADAPLIAPTSAGIPSERGSRRVRLVTLAAALSLASVSAYFSITGMTSIFVGAYEPVIGMGVALEVGKLAAVAWLGHQHGTASWRLRAALTILVAVLMGLNAIGCYGFLAKAHIGHQVEGDVAVAGRAADVEGRISVQSGLVTDLDRRIHQIDAAIETATQRGRTNAAMQLAADQRRNRAELATQRDQANKALAELKIEKAKADGDKKIAEADLGRCDTSRPCSAPTIGTCSGGLSWW